jgi:hypothetical protein
MAYRRPDFEVHGLRRMPARRQPNGYTCGSTCVRIMLDHLQFRPELSVDRLSPLMGTNPSTGTTEVEMARGLDITGLSHAHPSTAGYSAPGAALAHLRQVIDDGQVVFLRLLMHGYKHWVICHGHDGDDRFLVTCPAQGPQTWNGSRLLGYWSARSFDHFTSPARRSLHPRALAEEAQERLANWRPVHEMTLVEFTGGVGVVSDAKQSAWHHRMISDAADAIRHMYAQGGGRSIDYRSEGCPTLVFSAFERDSCLWDMVAHDASSGRLVGGIATGVRWVAPHCRGLGMGAEIALAAYGSAGMRFLMPSSYSEAGYGSRIAAHALAVSRALASGIEVPQRVLDSMVEGGARTATLLRAVNDAAPADKAPSGSERKPGGQLSLTFG